MQARTIIVVLAAKDCYSTEDHFVQGSGCLDRTKEEIKRAHTRRNIYRIFVLILREVGSTVGTTSPWQLYETSSNEKSAIALGTPQTQSSPPPPKAPVTCFISHRSLDRALANADSRMVVSPLSRKAVPVATGSASHVLSKPRSWRQWWWGGGGR